MNQRRSVYRRGTNLFFPTLFGAVSCTINWTRDMFHDCLDGRLTEFTFKPRSQIKPPSSPEPVFVNLTKSNPWTELRSKVMNVSRTLQLVKPAAWPTSESPVLFYLIQLWDYPSQCAVPEKVQWRLAEAKRQTYLPEVSRCFAGLKHEALYCCA